MSRSSDIVFLVGAGASVEATIPASAMMIGKLEELLRAHDEWREFGDLYNHIKSAIYYAAGLKGCYGNDVPYNIETLVNTLNELERNEVHPLYPFIAAWNSRIVSLAGADFRQVRALRRLLLRQLKDWMCPEDMNRADYYKGLVSLQRKLNFPLRAFSLNYDLCIERLSSQDFRVETGFAGVGPNHTWAFERFDEPPEGADPADLYLYKLHGSINWKRNDAKNLYCLEQIHGINPESMELIFGRDFKLEAADPYLFYAYEFRRWSLSAKVIALLGYGFGDEHINKILQQSLRNAPERRLFVVSACVDEGGAGKRRTEIYRQLQVDEAQIVVHVGTAREFLGNDQGAEILQRHIPVSNDIPF